MPIYEYRCTRCNRVFEEWVKDFHCPEHEPCPHCGADSVHIISHTSFILKGEGWYATESRKHSTDHESGAGAPDAAGGASPSDSGEGTEKGTENGTATREAAPAATGAGTDTSSD